MLGILARLGYVIYWLGCVALVCAVVIGGGLALYDLSLWVTGEWSKYSVRTEDWLEDWLQDWLHFYGLSSFRPGYIIGTGIALVGSGAVAWVIGLGARYILSGGPPPKR
jgi:hypothetical protein